ncbi:MAG: beta-galactosidase [Anaerolineae bacterium]|nr:beta-galactosidase [Anaerolineae bacterium]MDW8098049.1 beta-galactosidase [Anaerolineae bacterium]
MPLEPFIPFAVWYTGGRTRATMVRPPDADAPQSWKKDLETIRDCGFNAVRCWVDWASGEPQPGDYHFEALDLLMSLAEEVGLKVIIQIYLDSAPDWLVKYYPDCRYVSADGVSIDSQGAPGYCYDHPGVRSAAERFLTTLANHVSSHPNFYAWDLWSEPHIVQWGYFDFLPQPAVFCYCHHTAQRFRDWLRDKYRGDLAALNAAWYRQFSSWDLVLPPKFISLMSYTDYLDWLQFILEKLAQDLRWRHEVIRRVDHHITTSHSAVPSVLTLPIDEQGSPDDWLMARSVDIWGTSLYPKHVGAKETQDPSFRSAMLTSTRSACDANGVPYWLGELQGGHGYVGMFAAHMTEADARSYTWHSLAHGAKGLCFYAWHPMSSGYESAGFGLAYLDGTPSDRAIAAGTIARMVCQHMELFYRGRPPQAQAAICWNVYANKMWTCMRQPWHYIPSRSYIGAYRALYRARVPADFVHVDEIATGKLSRYRALYLPFAFMLTRQAAEQIGAFVAQGGVVLAEARTAWNDEKGYCGLAVPGFGLEQVFGCRERGTQGVDENTPIPIRIVRAHPLIPLLWPGDIVFGSRFREVLDPLADDAVVIGEFEDGSPAIVAHRYGQGWALFVGTLLSLAFYRFQDVNAEKLLSGLLQAAGIEPPVTVTGVSEAADIEPRLLEGISDDGHPYAIFFAFNHGLQELEPGFELKAPGDRCQVIDLITGEAVPCQIRDGCLSLSRRLQPTEIWVVLIITS